MKMSVVAWRVPVDPRSTSASPPPNTWRGPEICSFESTSPRNTGVDPNGPLHKCVTKFSHERLVMAIWPLASIQIAGSLAPSGRSNGVLVKAWLGVFGAGAAMAVTVKMQTNRTSSEAEIGETVLTVPPKPGEISGNPRSRNEQRKTMLPQNPRGMRAQLLRRRRLREHQPVAVQVDHVELQHPVFLRAELTPDLHSRQPRVFLVQRLHVVGNDVDV